ncbi:putative calcium-binding protein,FG-GAP repeat protein, partial [Leptothrix ochracea L12]
TDLGQGVFGQVSVLNNNGAGFDSPQTYGLAQSNNGLPPLWIGTRDLNQDGLPDIIVSDAGASAIRVLTNTHPVAMEDPSSPLPVTLKGADIDGTVAAFRLVALPDPAIGTLYSDAAGTLPIVADPNSGLMELPAASNSATLYFQPALNWNGTTNLAYIAVDDLGATSTSGLRSLTITPVNDAPILSSAAAVLADGTVGHGYLVSATELLAGWTDPEGSSVQVQGLTTPQGVVFDQGNGTWLVTPIGAAAGPLTLTYSVSDGQAGTPTSLSVNLLADTSGNLTPSAGPVSVTPIISPEDTPLALSLTGSDTDGTIAGFRLSLTPGAGQIFADAALTLPLNLGQDLAADATGSATVYFQPAANWNGPTSLGYVALDNAGALSAQTAVQALDITPVNDPPALTGTPATLPRGEPGLPYIVTPAALLAGWSDVENATLSVINVVSDHGTIYPNPDGSWTVNSPIGYSGPITLSYTVSDGTTGQSPATLGLDMIANQAPVAGPLLTAASVQNGMLGDGNEVLRSSQYSNTPTHFDSYQISNIQPGTQVSIAVTGAIASMAYLIVLDQNGGLVQESPFQSSLTFGANPGYQVLVGSFFDTNYSPNYPSMYQVSIAESNGLTGVTLSPNLSTNSGLEDGVVAIPLNGTDADGQVSAFRLSNWPGNTIGSFYLDPTRPDLVMDPSTTDIPATNQQATLYFKPAPNWNGQTAIDYLAIDNQGLTSVQAATQTLLIAPVNDPPALTGTPATLVGGVEDTTPYVLSSTDLLAGWTDVDGNPLSVSSVNAWDTNGSTYINAQPDPNGQDWLLNLPANYNGNLQIQYTVSDGFSPTSATLSLNIAAVNDPPTLLGTQFSTPQSYPVPYNGASGQNVAIGDLHGDGFLDILTPGGSSGTISLLKGHAGGGFDPVQTVNVPNASLTQIAMGDVTGDGLIDVVASGLDYASFTAAVYVFPQQANGTFGASQVLSASTSWTDPSSLTLVDLNGDQRLDILTTDRSTNQATLFNGNANGSANGNGFGPAQTLTVGNAATAIATADLNGDGRLDIVAARADYGSATPISVLLGANTGGFTPAVAYYAAGTSGNMDLPIDVALGDVDGDGKLDIVTANSGTGQVAVLKGLGDGTFGAATTYNVGTNPISLTLADLNGDGRLDILTAVQGNGGSTGQLAILNNNGAGFDSAQTYGTAQNGGSFAPLWVGTHDLNLDGLPDIIVADGGASAIRVLTNSTPRVAEDPATPVPLTLKGADLDGTVAAFRLNDLPVHGTVYTDATRLHPVNLSTDIPADASNQATIYFVPELNWNGITQIHVNAIDNGGAVSVAPEALQVVITPVNDAPVAPSAPSVSAALPNALEDSAYDISQAQLLKDWTDPENTPLQVLNPSVDHGTLVPGAVIDTWTLTPEPNYNGPITLHYAVSDGALQTAATLGFDVTAVNDPPVQVTPMPLLAPQTAGQDFTLPLPAGTFTDVDSATLSYSAHLSDGSALPSWLQCDPSNGSLSGTLSSTPPGWVPNHDLELSLVLSVSDGALTTSAPPVTLSVLLPSTHGLSNQADTYTGTASDEVIWGLYGNDAISGGAGNDTINGGAGADTMNGGSGNDVYVVDNTGDRTLEAGGEGFDTVQASIDWTLTAEVENLLLIGAGPLNGSGNSLDNLINGNVGNNLLDGGAGNDVISGGQGNDRLVGGLGQDVLEGGAGADTFAFTSTLDSTVARPDQVMDFQARINPVDRIDLSAIDAMTGVPGDQAFLYIGAASFSQTAGELRFSGGLLSGDTNGDGVADFAIQLVGGDLLP